MEMLMDKLLTVNQCAEITATTPAFWRKLLGRRAIPFVKVGRLTRIRQSDLEAWLRLGLRPLGSNATRVFPTSHRKSSEIPRG